MAERDADCIGDGIHSLEQGRAGIFPELDDLNLFLIHRIEELLVCKMVRPITLIVQFS
jgi:hypothetical protein